MRAFTIRQKVGTMRQTKMNESRDDYVLSGGEVTNAAIVVNNLSKIYGDIRAVDGLSFEVQQGQVFSLLGHNGAGKTTTVEILEGLRNPTSGKGTVFGVDITNDYGKLRSKVGILPQDFEPFSASHPWSCGVLGFVVRRRAVQAADQGAASECGPGQPQGRQGSASFRRREAEAGHRHGHGQRT